MDNLQTQVEVLERKRSQWLTFNLIAFTMWDGARIIANYVMHDPAHPILTGFTLFGGIFWIISLLQILRLGKRMKKDMQVLRILNDDLIELNRLRSWRLALVVVALNQCLIIMLSLFGIEISGILAAELSIFVLVIAAIGGFLYYDRESNA